MIVLVCVVAAMALLIHIVLMVGRPAQPRCWVALPWLWVKARISCLVKM
jgi:hypothetical protein